MDSTKRSNKRVAFDQASQARFAWITRALQEWFGVTKGEAAQYAIQRRSLEAYAAHLEALRASDDPLRDLAWNVERQRMRSARKGADLGVPLVDILADEPLRPLSVIAKDWRARQPSVLEQLRGSFRDTKQHDIGETHHE